MITFLRSNYGKIEVISANLLAELERRKKPGDNDIRIRPDDGGTHLTIHYRERIEGKECKFQHLETIPTPIAGSELARHKINEKPISSTLSCVKFDFGKL